MRWGILAMAFLLGSCATAGRPPPIVEVHCIPLHNYTQEEQNKLADELANLPQDDPAAKAIKDYSAMRDADRACMDSIKK